VATAAENRLNIFPRNPHTSFAAASDCRSIAILSDQGNREDRKKKEGFFFFQKRG
jgi:hypothetical protein